MLKSDRSGLNYARLARRGRGLDGAGLAPLRIALLADASTQHLVPLLRVLLAENGFDARVYEAPYDTVVLEALDPTSGLHAFRPQVVFVLQATAKLVAAWQQAGDRAGLVGERARTAEAVWRAALAGGAAHVVQCTYVRPLERPYGHFGLKVDDTADGAVTALNRELVARARALPGVLLLDLDDLAGWVGRRTFLDERGWLLTRAPCALPHLPDLAQAMVDVALATQGRAIKCVVLDLDDTLWGGVIGDDGLDGIRLGDVDDGAAFRAFQLSLRELWRRGVLLAVCSKNDEAVARRPFREHPQMILREEHLAAFVANWNDKAQNIRSISDRLQIGLDSMVFLDDNPFERNLVRQLLPEVIVPELPEDPALYVRALAELNLFEAASRSELDARRGALYQEQERREEERAHFESLEAYLASLETTVRWSPFTARDLPRIAQLVQRSNQFNLTTRRYSEAECAAMIDDPDVLPFTLSVSDRFGDFGLVAVVILRRRPAALELDTFLMSCRVLQRGVEGYAMNRVFALAARAGAERVMARYLPTPRNGLVRDLLPRLGFVRAGATGTEGDAWELPVAAFRPGVYPLRESAPTGVLPAGPHAGSGAEVELSA